MNSTENIQDAFKEGEKLYPATKGTLCWPKLVGARSVHKPRQGFSSEVLDTNEPCFTAESFSENLTLL